MLPCSASTVFIFVYTAHCHMNGGCLSPNRTLSNILQLKRQKWYQHMWQLIKSLLLLWEGKHCNQNQKFNMIIMRCSVIKRFNCWARRQKSTLCGHNMATLRFRHFISPSSILSIYRCPLSPSLPTWHSQFYSS